MAAIIIEEIYWKGKSKGASVRFGKGVTALFIEQFPAAVWDYSRGAWYVNERLLEAVRAWARNIEKAGLLAYIADDAQAKCRYGICDNRINLLHCLTVLGILPAWAFSPSRHFAGFASLTFMPPYLAFHS